VRLHLFRKRVACNFRCSGMKYLIILFFLVVFQSNAQTVKVPETITKKFTEANPGVENVKWSRDSVNYKVTFSDAAQHESIVYYDADGKVIRSERQLMEKDVPTAIRQYYSDKYPNENSFSVWVVEDAEGNRSYYTNRKDETIYFDKTGQISKDVSPSNH
jgi:hypothetical protein